MIEVYMTHFLNSNIPFFEDILEGIKTIELRPPTDGVFAVGDIIKLSEFDNQLGTWTSRSCDVVVSWISPEPNPGLVEGYTNMSIKLLKNPLWRRLLGQTVNPNSHK
jgi:hypothetical protein